MNEQFEKLMYESGLTAQGCWDEMDSYMHDAIKQFAELIIQECLDQLHVGDTDEDYDKGAYWSREQIKNHFGVEE